MLAGRTLGNDRGGVVMYTLAIINQKGGVGKTTSVVTVGHGLAIAGARVLLVDLDAQGNVADMLGLDKTDGLYRFLYGNNSSSTAITSSGRERLDAILGNKMTVEAKQRLTGQDFREYVLQDALEPIDGYDVCILDVAPGVDILQVAALVACDGFIIPTELSHLAIVGATDALNSAADLMNRSRGSCGQFIGVLPTMWERTTNESHEQLQTLVELFGELGWPPIPLDVKAREASAHGQTLWEYAPECRALRGVEIGGVRRGGYRQVLQRLAVEIQNHG